MHKNTILNNLLYYNISRDCFYVSILLSHGIFSKNTYPPYLPIDSPISFIAVNAVTENSKEKMLYSLHIQGDPPIVIKFWMSNSLLKTKQEIILTKCCANNTYQTIKHFNWLIESHYFRAPISFLWDFFYQDSLQISRKIFSARQETSYYRSNMKLETTSPSIVHWASHNLNTNYKNYWIFHELGFFIHIGTKTTPFKIQLVVLTIEEWTFRRA